MIGRKPMSGVRDISRGGPLVTRMTNLFSRRVTATSFSLDSVLTAACDLAGVAKPSNPESDLENYRWWNKLCNACGEKKATKYGSNLLHQRLVNALSQKLSIDEIFRLNGHEISKETIEAPLVVMGLPRSNGHLAAHVLSRSGLFLAMRQCDTLSPSLMREIDRMDRFRRYFRGFERMHPDFLCVRVPQWDQIDDDLSVHLMVPQSLAWGLLHGLDGHLLESLEEDQTPVYLQVKRVMQLLQWYRRCGHFTESVTKEFQPIDNPLETQTYGTKGELIRPPWLLFSPFAILNSASLVHVFPDCRILWIHRALAQGVPSLCSSLSLHNALYTGRPPTDSQLTSMGEKVLGLFGSGTDNAIEYFSQFSQSRMAHWSNRDAKRHTTRLATKTVEFFGMEVDRYRRMQMINGQTEYTARFRPLHDAQMPYFRLHEGILDDVFRGYIHQFEEFAFEKRLGVNIEEYTPLAAAADQMSAGVLSANPSSSSSLKTALGSGQPMSGHYLQEGKGFR